MAAHADAATREIRAAVDDRQQPCARIFGGRHPSLFRCSSGATSTIVDAGVACLATAGRHFAPSKCADDRLTVPCNYGRMETLSYLRGYARSVRGTSSLTERSITGVIYGVAEPAQLRLKRPHRAFALRLPLDTPTNGRALPYLHLTWQNCPVRLTLLLLSIPPRHGAETQSQETKGQARVVSRATPPRAFDSAIGYRLLPTTTGSGDRASVADRDAHPALRSIADSSVKEAPVRRTSDQVEQIGGLCR
jgi:hypothetical protein